MKLLRNDNLDWWNDPSLDSFITTDGSLSLIFSLLNRLYLGKNYTNYFPVCHLPRFLEIQLSLNLVLNY